MAESPVESVPVVPTPTPEATAEDTLSLSDHEARMTGHEHGASHAHELAIQQRDHAHELASMQLEHQQTLEQQEQAADLAPESETETEGEPA